jgi:hypothetical protein
MRGWSVREQKQLEELQNRQTQLLAQYAEAINKLCADYVEPEHRAAVRELLNTRGQEVLDMLIDHIEPSPRVTRV